MSSTTRRNLKAVVQKPQIEEKSSTTVQSNRTNKSNDLKLEVIGNIKATSND